MTKAEAIQFYGTQQRLADVLGTYQGTVSSWDRVPYLQQLRLERITNGALVADPEAWGPALEKAEQ